MADLETIRAAIVDVLEGIEDNGLVQPFERYAKTEAGLQDLYVSDGRLFGWQVRRVATREISPDLGRWICRHEWQIRGLMALNDANESELVFDAQIEATRDAFRADETLGGVVASTVTESRAGIEVVESLPVMFAGVLCHSCKLALTTEHYL